MSLPLVKPVWHLDITKSSLLSVYWEQLLMLICTPHMPFGKQLIGARFVQFFLQKATINGISYNIIYFNPFAAKGDLFYCTEGVKHTQDTMLSSFITL